MYYSTSNITASYLHSVITSTKFVNQSEMIRCKMYILRLDYINIYGTGDIDLRNGEQREFQTRKMSNKGNVKEREFQTRENYKQRELVFTLSAPLCNQEVLLSHRFSR